MPFVLTWVCVEKQLFGVENFRKEWYNTYIKLWRIIMKKRNGKA